MATDAPPPRHPLPVRIAHWLNVLVLVVMLGSGLQILMAHPTLYWGSRSDPQRAWLAFHAQQTPSGELRGVTRFAGRAFDTTGLFGVTGPQRLRRAFPEWATLPGPRWLAMGRRWHFFFAWLLVINGIAYAAYTLASRHRRELFPNRRDLAGFGRSVRHHLHLRQLRRDSLHGYNPLQKLSYVGVVFILGPLVLLTGLTMSPMMDSAFPWLLDLFGGRQSARSIHFLAIAGLLLFFVLHIAMLLVGPVAHVRAMITGRLKRREGAQ